MLGKTVAVVSVVLLLSLSLWCEGAQQSMPKESIKATVTMIDGDMNPETTPGPGTTGIIALDYNFRSLFIALEKEELISEIILKSNPGTNNGKASNKNLRSDNIELYFSSDNVTFSKLQPGFQVLTDKTTIDRANVTFRKLQPTFSVLDKYTVILDGFRVKAKYLKVHTICDKATDYEFVNYVERMVPTFTRPRSNAEFYRLKDPLFESLLSNTPGPGSFLYWSGNCGIGDGPSVWNNTIAKKFGLRYVYQDELAETAQHKLIYGTKNTSDLQRYGISTWRWIVGEPGEPFIPLIGDMPPVFDGQGWMMDPRWLGHYYEQAVKKAKENAQWSLFSGDEVWEVFAIKAVPKDKRYDEVITADKEIRDNYGFGKYGMPDSDDDADPFARIAHRRWVSDKLTDLYRRTYQSVKAVNPNMVMLAPDFASAVPAGDIEAWAPYFDIFTAQCGMMPSPFVYNFGVGCDTKILSDLSGKPVWMAVQNTVPSDYGQVIDPERIREMYSQIYRNGGQGIFVLASEWFDRELGHPKYADPARWKAMLDVVDQAAKMNRVKLPEKADCAILYSSDTLLTLRFGQFNENGHQEIRSMYATIGPMLRSWFHFVSDRQIDRGIRNLSDYKVLYVPFAEFERGSVFDKIEAYVKDGGTVVCTDTDAFSWDINGESLTDRWQKLSGVRRDGEREAGLSASTIDSGFLGPRDKLSFDFPVSGWNLSPIDDKVEILAAFSDGSPAITVHHYGKGKVVFFASDPFGLRSDSSSPLVFEGSPMVAFFGGIQKAVGAKMGLDIWRFKLPPFPEEARPDTRLCLTGNYVFSSYDPIRKENNVETGGTYTYIHPPTGLRDSANGTAPISFAEGRLTDRVQAYESRRLGYFRLTEAEKKKISTVAENWIVSWTDPDPMAVSFDLKKKDPLTEVRFFYSGALPSVKIMGSVDGKAWKRLASAPGRTATTDVVDVALPLKGSYRHLKLNFGARKSGDEFELIEVEIWGDQQR